MSDAGGYFPFVSSLLDGVIPLLTSCIQEELAEGIALTGEQHEMQLAYYGTHGERYSKHRDGFPNDGSKQLTQQPGDLIHSLRTSLDLPSFFHL